MRNWTWIQWFIVFGGFTVVVLTGLVIYLLLNPTSTTTPPLITEDTPLSQLPQILPGSPQFPSSPVEQIPLTQIQGIDNGQTPDLIAKGGLTQTNSLTEFPIDFINLAGNGNEFYYYDPQNAQFFRINKSGVITQINQNRFANVESVVLANNAQDAILEFPDGNNILYNFETDQQLTLPNYWQDFDFSPDSNSIAFKSLPNIESDRWLAIADKSGSRAKLIEPLGFNDSIVNVDWSPNNQVIATYTEPEGLRQSELYYLGFNNENFKLSQINGVKVDTKWSPQGTNLLVNASPQQTGFRPVLTVLDGSGSSLGQNRRELGLQTWVEKCTFSTDSTMYCGVPTSLPEGAGLIPAVAKDINDQIYKIDLQTGAVNLLAIPDENINVEQIIVSEDESTLLVKDRFTSSLKQIKLSEEE